MSTPREIRNFVTAIKTRGFVSMTPQDYEQLCYFALSNLPQQSEIRGKECPHCTWKIGNAARTCKNCGKRVDKQRPVFVPPVDGVNDCKGECAEDLTGREHHELGCGHKFCTGCMRNRVLQGFRTCCLCDRVRITDAIRQKYLPEEL